MKICKKGGYCKPYRDANGVLRCEKCEEQIDKNENVILNDDVSFDEEPDEPEMF